MTATVTPMRLRNWEPPAHGTLYRSRRDGTVWTVAGVYRVDQQVRLEREGERAVYPFGNMLIADWEQVAL